MEIQDFPVCCTAHIISDFGEAFVAEGIYKKYTVAQIVRYIRNKAKLLIYDDHAMFTAITNTEQKEACKALKKLGFGHSKWMEKKQHADTKVRLWYIAIADLK